MPKSPKVTDFQERVYTLLLQIPRGKVTTYQSLARALSTSPRAVGNALRHNPFAPHVPCHRVITSAGYIGGFMGECNAAPSGVNQRRKREILRGEGVVFDDAGMVLGVGRGEETGVGGEGKGWKEGGEVWFDGPWDLGGKREKGKEKGRRFGSMGETLRR